MRNRYALVVAVSVCLALAFTPILADRGDRTLDRTKSSPRQDAVGSQNRVAIHPVVAATPLQFRDEAPPDASLASRAQSHMAMAAAAGEGQKAISHLMQAVTLGEQSGNEKLLTEAYLQLGNLYEGTPSKQVTYFSHAMQLTSNPALRSELQIRITALGGDLFQFGAAPGSQAPSMRDVGPDDTCDGAEAITIPWDEVMTITPSGDHNWRMFEVPSDVDGWTVLIETVSYDIYGDDTDLRLYGGCDAGVPTDYIGFDDDGGPGFLSSLTGDCLPPGTYYIEVGGWNNTAQPDDFNLVVTHVETCINPVYPEAPDGYEPDDLRSEAAGIGNPTSTPPHSNGWGRVHSEIQDHVIFPSGDIDHVEFSVLRPEMVRAGVASEFPTFFNDFSSMPFGTIYDSYIELLYGVEPYYGGLCNDPGTGFNPYCRTDADCPEPAGTPLPGYPTCIPIYYFTFGGTRYWWPENPLAFNEDKSFSDWGSEVAVCLPRSDQQTTSLTANGDWVLRVMSSPVWDPEGTFYYQVQVRNEVQCNFEVEPNNGPFGANPIELGGTYHGFQDLSEFLGTQGVWDGAWFTTDPDWLQFDVETDSVVTFETDGYDIYWCDTYLQLYAGPDDYGTYYILSASDDDGGPGYLSFLSVLLPPASELLGNTSADADYFLDVTTQYPVPNFPWTLYTHVETYSPPIAEIEPNDTCDLANEAMLGDTFVGAIAPACDYDAYGLSLAEDTYVVFETDGGDTTIKLTNSDGDYLGCDDDGGPGLASRIEGCLPAGDYCLRVRAYGSSSTIDPYELSVSDGGSCVAMDPPVTIYDELYRCDNAQEPNEFDNCPNALGD